MTKQLTFSKEDQENIKLYFSAVSARRCSMMYLGITEHKSRYILSNMEPTKLVIFCDATLGLHFIEVKSSEINKSIKKLFRWLDLDEESLFVIALNNVLSYLNNNKWDTEKATWLKDSNDIRYYTVMDKKKNEEKRVALAYPNRVYQAAQYIKDVYDSIEHYLNVSPEEYNECRLEDIDPTQLDKNVIMTNTIKMTEYTPDSHIEKFNIVLVDGAETVSCKSFIKKIKDKEYKYYTLSWLADNCIEYCSVYDDEDVKVVSTRPHTRIYTKPTKRRKKA